MCVIEEQDSSKTVDQSTDTTALSSAASPTLKVWFQCCIIFNIKSQLCFVGGWSFIFTLSTNSNITFHICNGYQHKVGGVM